MGNVTQLKGGLRRRILAWFLVLSLVPLFLSNTVGYQVTRRIIEGQVRRFLMAITEVEARHVATEIERHQQNLDAVAAGNTTLARGVALRASARQAGRADPSVDDLLREHLERKLRELRPFSELFVLDMSGVVLAATRPGRVGADWSGTSLLLAGGRDRFFTEDLDAVGGLVSPVYRLATPVRDADGRPVGVLAATVGFERVQGFLRISPHLAGDIHTFVVDREGRPLFASHPRPGLEYGSRLASPLIVAGREGTQRYTNYEGVEVVGASVAVPGHAWRYLAEAPVASVFGQLHGLALLAAVLEAGFALLLVAVVWMVARSIVSPLRGLVGAAERLRGGELGVEVQIDRADELGDLGRTFNQMSRELRASAHRIQELHDQEMRRAAQLASVGELASGIAHEIKNPVIGVVSGLDLLSARVGDDATSGNIVTQMRAQLRRIEAAIQDLLSYARPKAPRTIWTDPTQLVDRVVGLVSPQAEAAGVRIETRQVPAIPKIKVDPDLMTQTLVNLALNGIQAMTPGGVLTFTATRTGTSVRIGVSDTGTGISPDELEKIFRPFYTTKHQGTGLGLAITRGIVDRHGGSIEVSSEPGRGSTFTLVFAAPAREGANA
ncbi:MAG: ATP-binding protein [Gemmatimonadota bacterium]|nr:ATP-binding protein [Gemmatimonadota bacterium]